MIRGLRRGELQGWVTGGKGSRGKGRSGGNSDWLREMRGTGMGKKGRIRRGKVTGVGGVTGRGNREMKGREGAEISYGR
jgi:hypothetical protein